MAGNLSTYGSGGFLRLASALAALLIRTQVSRRRVRLPRFTSGLGGTLDEAHFIKLVEEHIYSLASVENYLVPDEIAKIVVVIEKRLRWCATVMSEDQVLRDALDPLRQIISAVDENYLIDDRVQAVAGILANRRHEIRKQSSPLAEFNLKELIKRAVDNHGPASSASRIDFKIRVPEELTIATQSEHFECILHHLLLNARAAIRRSDRWAGGRIIIGARDVKVRGVSYLELTLRDNGTGFTPSGLKALANSEDDAFRNGAGLRTVAGIASAYEGHVIVESTFNEGSEVLVRFHHRRLFRSSERRPQ